MSRDRTAAGSIMLYGEEHYVGQVTRAAKNLFMWKLFSSPLTLRQADHLLNRGHLKFVEKGRAKSWEQAEADMVKAYRNREERFNAVSAQLSLGQLGL